MGDFANFCSTIADWANRQDWSPALVTSFVRMAEQKFNAELRVDRMINFSTNTVTMRCSTLPDDWLEMDLVQIQNPNAPSGFSPIRYKARDEFFNLPDRWAYGYYTIEARTIFFGGCPDQTEGIQYNINYYGEVPVFSDAPLVPSWIYTKYPSMYLHAAMMHADLHAVGEEQNAANMKALAEDAITKLNNEHLRAKASGSRLSRTRRRRF
jgi:hypothetical protein